MGAELYLQCKDVCTQFLEASQIPFPRSVVGENGGVMLMVFADASKIAMAAVIYTRVDTPQGFRCTVLTTKTKIALARPTSIPRLELTAAVMAVRLAQTVQHAMPV